VVDFIAGANALACATVALFFLRFSRETADRLFAIFALAFGVFAVNRLALALLEDAHEARTLVYLSRFLAFALIAYAILYESRSPGGTGSAAAARVVALSGHEDRTTVMEMLAAGASRYLVKGAEPEELIEVIHAVARGEHTLSKQVTDGVVGALTEQLSLQTRSRAARRRSAQPSSESSTGVW
jgi:hypothetical protein